MTVLQKQRIRHGAEVEQALKIMMTEKSRGPGFQNGALLLNPSFAFSTTTDGNSLLLHVMKGLKQKNGPGRGKFIDGGVIDGLYQIFFERRFY